MAGLLLAEQIARAANIEIMAGKLEAGTQRIERLQHLQPLYFPPATVTGLVAGRVNSA